MTPLLPCDIKNAYITKNINIIILDLPLLEKERKVKELLMILDDTSLNR